MSRSIAWTSMSDVDQGITDQGIAGFIARWQGVTGPERANYQLFLTELTAALGLPAPEPAEADAGRNAYCFERRVAFRHGDGSESYGYIDLYRRGAFVLEAKDVKAPEGSRYDRAMLRARGQAEDYARALPAEEGRPPFLIVVDVGHSIELYSEFTRSGATYTPFPDPRSHRLALAALERPEIRERLRQVWLDPLALDPSRDSARVTREIAARLARLARALEQGGHDPEEVAGFLTRCLFTLFAEDVGLLPVASFERLLRDCSTSPQQFVPLVHELWQAMNDGAFSAAIQSDLLRFNPQAALRRARPRRPRRLRLGRPRPPPTGGQRQRPAGDRRRRRAPGGEPGPRRGPARAAGGAQRRARRRGAPGPGALAAPRLPEPRGGPGRRRPGRDRPRRGCRRSGRRRHPPPPLAHGLTAQVSAVAEALAATPEPLTEPELAARFTARGPWRRRLGNILDMLVTLGQARQEGDRYRGSAGLL